MWNGRRNCSLLWVSCTAAPLSTTPNRLEFRTFNLKRPMQAGCRKQFHGMQPTLTVARQTFSEFPRTTVHEQSTASSWTRRKLPQVVCPGGQTFSEFDEFWAWSPTRTRPGRWRFSRIRSFDQAPGRLSFWGLARGPNEFARFALPPDGQPLRLRESLALRRPTNDERKE